MSPPSEPGPREADASGTRPFHRAGDAELRRPGRGRRAVLVLGALAAVAVPIAFWRLRPDPNRLLIQAQADFQAGRYAPAEAALRRLERLRAPTPMDRMARAQVAWGLKRGADALEELARIPDDNALAPLAHLLAGQIEVKRDRLRAAEAHFLATLKAEPKAIQAHRELVYFYNVQHRQAELDEHLHVLSDLGALDYEQVLHWNKTRNVVWNPQRDCEALAGFLAADPGDRHSRLALVDGLRQLGRLDEADRVLGALPGSDPEARARYAQQALARGDQERAIRLLAGGPADHPALARLRGLLALSQGDRRGAVAALRVALAADDKDRAVLFALGTALKGLGDEEGARPYLEAARRHDALTPLITRASSAEGKKDPHMASQLAAACEEAGRLYESLAWYRLAVAQDPLDAAAQRGIARLDRKIAGPSAASRGPNGANDRG